MKRKESRGSNTHIRQTDFKTKAITKDKEGHYIVIKGQIQEEGITLIKIYAPSMGVPKYIKQILIVIKGEIDNNTKNRKIVGNFNTTLTSMERSSRQKKKTTNKTKITAIGQQRS